MSKRAKSKDPLLEEETTLLTNIFHAPRLSFRLTIPSTSEIFKVASYGTVSQLHQILVNRAEYWNVYDENGVSLIHVSPLISLNKSILIM